MKPNIFINKNLSNEDHFTVSLGYILNVLPTIIGDRFINKLAVMSGKTSGSFGKFIEAEFIGFEFQNYDSNSKPDMVIRTTQMKLFFENKIFARLSQMQLERHLKDVNKAKGKLVFVSNIQSNVSDYMLSKQSYVKPTGKHHFVWADFESVFDVKLKNNPIGNRILNDFRTCLRTNGMKGRQIIGADDNLYTNGSKAESHFLDRLAELLRTIGFKAWRNKDEYTLRVNLVKSGNPPLLNPRLYSSGEWLNESLISECIIVDCISNQNTVSVKKKIDYISKMMQKNKSTKFYGYDNYGLFGHLYIPMKFVSIRGRYDCNWNHLKETWYHVYKCLNV